MPLEPTAKASASFSSADASPKATTDTLIKAKPKPSAPPPADETLMKPKPKGGGTPAAKAEDEPDAKKQKTEEPEAEPKQATITKKWAKKALDLLVVAGSPSVATAQAAAGPTTAMTALLGSSRAATIRLRTRMWSVFVRWLQ